MTFSTKVTASQRNRVEKDWGVHAGEPVEVEGTCSQSAILGFASELGCLRIFYKMKHGRVQFSENLNRWYYSNK